MSRELSVSSIRGLSPTFNVNLDEKSSLDITSDLTLSGQNYLPLPTGGSGDRNLSPVEGSLRYNSDTNLVEVYHKPADGTAFWHDETVSELENPGTSGGGVAQPPTPTPNASLPSGYKIGVTYDTASPGAISGSTWSLTAGPSASDFVGSGGIGNTGYHSGDHRAVNSGYYRVSELSRTTANTNLTFACWYKGFQNVSPPTYGPAVALLGDHRNSVYGGFGISNGRAEFRDSGNSYAGSRVDTGQWTHIGFTLSSSATLKIYINGVLDATHTSISINSNTRTSDLAGHWAYSPCVAPHAFDAAVIYDGVLSDADMLQIYQARNFT